MDLPDRVVLVGGAGNIEMTVQQFLRLPLSERIAHVLQRTATFYRRGHELDSHEALAALRLARVQDN